MSYDGNLNPVIDSVSGDTGSSSSDDQSLLPQSAGPGRTAGEPDRWVR